MATKTGDKKGRTAFNPFKHNKEIYNEDHEMFRTSLRKFIEKEVTPYFQQWEEDHYTPRELFNKMGEQGFLCPQVDPAYGGLGLDFGFNRILAEETARVGSGLGTASLHSTVVVPYLEIFGSEEQKKKYLPKFVSGEMLTAVAMTEPGTGSDLSGLNTTAVKDGDHYVINGQKTFITNGINADLIFVAVKTDTKIQPAHRGISMIMVEADTPGFSKGRKLKKLGGHSQDTAELIFEDVRVPAENLLGEEGKGFYYLMEKLQQERIICAEGALALAQEMLKSTIDYVKEREAFGQPISKFQNTQFEIAEMTTELTIGRTFLDSLASRHMNGEDIATEVSMAKWWITDMARRMSSRCLQLHGGYGYMEEYEIARRYRDVAVMPIYAGSNEIMKNIIAKNIGL
ncbi:acyl-CoA dehydrogenase family protein [Bacillus sp. CRN 9]|uniref:acyl-CoA dehydrogenase family protein n=1 Tax=Cytobacillus horneckiae TaxID=549687 RepID=UPI001561DAD1|nr:acyl-CoA dehydrogenase family protein [Bacillus sp. CRN 9]